MIVIQYMTLNALCRFMRLLLAQRYAVLSITACMQVSVVAL
jgi:hypothetical protein